MVGYHPLDGHSPSQGQGWSPIIPGMVTYQPYVGHPLSRITFPNIVAQLPKDGHPRSSLSQVKFNPAWAEIGPAQPFNGRLPSIEDNLKWKMIFDRGQPLMEGDL